MPITIQPADPARPEFAGRVGGIDIAAGVSPAEAARIEHAMDHYGILIFHNQRVTDEQQYAFSQHFGPMETAANDLAMAAAGRRRLSENINDISNLDADGNVLARDNRRRLAALGNMLWHSDSSFKRTPAKYSLLSARVIPAEGGNTEFADMRAAWDALDEETKAICLPLVCDHSQIYSRGLIGFDDFTEDERVRFTPVPQRLVRRHEGSGRRSLYLSAHAGTIHGWPVPEARAFLRDLNEHATQRRFVHAHRWQPYDLVMWDNRCTMHRARRYDHTQPRDLHRTTVADRAPTLEQPQ